MKIVLLSLLGTDCHLPLGPITQMRENESVGIVARSRNKRESYDFVDQRIVPGKFLRFLQSGNPGSYVEIPGTCVSSEDVSR